MGSLQPNQYDLTTLYLLAGAILVPLGVILWRAGHPYWAVLCGFIVACCGMGLATGPAHATGVPGADVFRSVPPQPVPASLQIKVMYQAGPAGDTAADVPAPRQQDVSLALTGNLPSTVRATVSTPYIAQCSTVTGQDPQLTPSAVETGLALTLTHQGDKAAAALIDVHIDVSDLQRLQTVQSGECQIGMPQVSSSKFQQTIAVPLDGTPAVVRTEGGGQLVLKVVRT